MHSQMTTNDQLEGANGPIPDRDAETSSGTSFRTAAVILVALVVGRGRPGRMPYDATLPEIDAGPDRGLREASTLPSG